MNYFDIITPQQEDNSTTSLERLPSRPETVDGLSGTTKDIVVIGGGIHGAAVAWLAALSGLSVGLLERSDYASETSSRSSKMAHGGLRYLEYFDFEQVREGVQERERWFNIAPHLVKPQEFFVPVRSNFSWERIRLGIGLGIYDFFAGKKGRKHRWISKPQFIVPHWCQGGYLYTDGIVRDEQLVQELIVAARQEGALCLNHAEVIVVNHQKDNTVAVTWKDSVTNERHELKAGVVINCAGPWVGTAGRVTKAEFSREIKFSRGSHLIFSTPWVGPALTIKLSQKGRYYFVCPHPRGTLVGTTEREVPAPASQPTPSQDEIDEIVGHLKNDLPLSGLSQETLIDAFAGIRTLVLRSGNKATPSLSRKHRWLFSGGMLNLIGGKLTTALWTAREGLELIGKLSGKKVHITTSTRVLPGAAFLDERLEEFRRHAGEKGIDKGLVNRLIEQYGSFVRWFTLSERAFEKTSSGELYGEITLKKEVFQKI